MHSPSTVGRRRSGLWVSIGQMPNIALGSERSRSITRLRHVATDTFGKDVVFKVTDTLGSETGADEEKETRRDDQEPMESTRRSRSVDEVSDDCTTDETDNDGDRDGFSLDSERDLK